MCPVCIFYQYDSYHPTSLQGWTTKAERIKSPAPFPEDTATPQLTKMLVPAPYQAPEKKGKEPKGGLMTHKYRGSIIVLSMSKSVEPNEEQKEMTSGFPQGNVCKH